MCALHTIIMCGKQGLWGHCYWAMLCVLIMLDPSQQGQGIDEGISNGVTFTADEFLSDKDNLISIETLDYLDKGHSRRHWDKSIVFLSQGKSKNKQHYSNALKKERHKRQLGVTNGLTEEQKIESLVIHNTVRRLEPSSDMEFVVSMNYMYM